MCPNMPAYTYSNIHTYTHAYIQRECGLDVELSDVPVDSLVPDALKVCAYVCAHVYV